MRAGTICSGISGTKLLILGAILVWFFLFVLITYGVFRNDSTVDFSKQAENQRIDQILEQITLLNTELKDLKRQNEELKKLTEHQNEILNRQDRGESGKFQQKAEAELENVRKKAKEVLEKFEAQKEERKPEMVKVQPGEQGKKVWQLYSTQHEVARRSLDNSIRELYFYTLNQLEKHKDKEPVNAFYNHTLNQMLSLLAESSNFGSTVDNSGEWHQQALQNLSSFIQNRIKILQNPEDCAKARILLCDLNKGCGFGCQLHHVAYCLIVAAGTNRTMVFEKDGTDWRYSQKGWTSVFLPVTSCSHSAAVPANTNVQSWAGVEQTDRVVRLPIVDGLSHHPEHLPLSFPKQISEFLLAHHSNPPVYFIAHFIWYLMRNNEHMEKVLKEAEQKIPFGEGPIVGLQIRRTDKIGTEASFHSVPEYMKWAEHWFRIQEYRNNGTAIKRRVFIATDDPNAVKEAKEGYPNYEVFADTGIAQTAQVNSRYTDASLYGVITDIQMLSKCDYLVCTFSSQVCRVGFELMQVLKGDAGDLFHSLDDIYYYGGQLAHDEIAVEAYKAEKPDEIDLEVGDSVGIAGNHWDGFSKGQNRRTGKTGLYPSYKTREKWRIVNFGIFSSWNS
uniref:Alpha-(1,6)-fucosyltransferase n=1 Tax=Acrobeloides nanus TaxID=290746 RepID=A0A914CQI2_9BILA